MRWAEAMEFAGRDVAMATFAFEVTAGNEEILAEMAESALGYVRQKSAEAMRAAGGGR